MFRPFTCPKTSQWSLADNCFFMMLQLWLFKDMSDMSIGRDNVSLYTNWHVLEKQGEKKKSSHNLRYSTFFSGLRTHSVQLIPAEAASKVRWSEYDIKSRLKLETGYLFTLLFLSRRALLYCHLGILVTGIKMLYNVLYSFQLLIWEDGYFLYCALKAILHLPSFGECICKRACFYESVQIWNFEVNTFEVNK